MDEAQVRSLQLGQLVHASGRGHTHEHQVLAARELLEPRLPGKLYAVYDRVAIVDFRNSGKMVAGKDLALDTVLFEHLHLEP